LTALLLFALAVCACVPGCVRRRLTIRSNPPGALVYVDDQEIGYTPVSTPFVYYGTRKIQLVRDGYRTETVLQRFPAPWYEWPPLDFASENLWPRDIRDERVLDFTLVTEDEVKVDELRAQAENLRAMSRSGMVNPLPGSGVPVRPPVQALPPPTVPGGSFSPGAIPAGAIPPGGFPSGGILAPPAFRPPVSAPPSLPPYAAPDAPGAGLWLPPTR
jgi:hypothetical protein